MDKIEIVTNYVKLANYLNKNQLVQANALTQRMENQIRDDFEDKPPEAHPFFEVYKLVKQVQQRIVLGDRNRAIEITSQMRVSLQDRPEIKETMNEVKQSLGE